MSPTGNLVLVLQFCITHLHKTIKLWFVTLGKVSSLGYRVSALWFLLPFESCLPVNYLSLFLFQNGLRLLLCSGIPCYALNLDTSSCILNLDSFTPATLLGLSWNVIGRLLLTFRLDKVPYSRISQWSFSELDKHWCIYGHSNNDWHKACAQ